jgi:hypothetical protein
MKVQLSGSREKYLELLRWRRRDLQKDLDALSRQRQQLAQAEAAIVNQVRSLDTLLAAEEARGAGEFGARGPANSEFVAPPLIDDSSADVGSMIRDAAERVLREAGGPMHYKVIANRVQTMVPLRGKNPAATLLTFLTKDADRFCRVDRGCYSLNEIAAAGDGRQH